jgi:hypothetical protein
MTAAQKLAKEKFKKAIAIRSKTGVSLKEAFAQVYGKKKVGAVKKKAAKKKVVKKAAKKVVQKSKPRYTAKEHKNWGVIPEHKRRVNGLPKKKKVSGKKIGLSIAKKTAAKVKSLARKAQDAFYEGYYEGKPITLAKKRAELKAKRVNAAKKKVSEQSILNKIHKVKNEVNSLDELQHKHMIGSIDKYKSLQNEIKSYEAAIRKLKGNYYGLTSVEKVRAKLLIKRFMNAKNELKTHAAQLKKTF